MTYVSYSSTAFITCALLKLTSNVGGFSVSRNQIEHSLRLQKERSNHHHCHRTCSSSSTITSTILYATIEEETSLKTDEKNSSDGSSLLLDNNILSRIEEASNEAKQWAEDFDLVSEAGAPFFALFSGIRSSAALGLKGSPFYLKGEDFRKVMGGDNGGNDVDGSDNSDDPFNGYFTYDDLAKALEDDFLDANRGSTDNRQGWKVCFCDHVVMK